MIEEGAMAATKLTKRVLDDATAAETGDRWLWDVEGSGVSA